jgi:site-specific recombinase XerD
VLALLYRGGMRIGATLKLRPIDFDWDTNLITVHSDKGGKGRTIVVDDGAMDVLRAWKERRYSLGISGHYPFFCATTEHTKGKPLKTAHFRGLIAALKKKTGIEKRCHLHMFRHTYASELLDEGFDLPTISRMLGHSFLSTTSNYLHELRPDLMNTKLRRREFSL